MSVTRELTSYVLPPTVTDRIATASASSPMRPVSAVTVPVARAPRGIRPRRRATRAAKRSPTLLVFTQIRWPASRVSSEPDAIVATRAGDEAGAAGGTAGWTAARVRPAAAGGCSTAARRGSTTIVVGTGASTSETTVSCALSTDMLSALSREGASSASAATTSPRQPPRSAAPSRPPKIPRAIRSIPRANGKKPASRSPLRH